MSKFLYTILIKIFYIPFCLIIFFRIFINKEDKSKFTEKIFPAKFKRPDGYLFWFHVASLGEFNSIIPILNYFNEKNKNYNFLITTTTLSSYKEFKKKYEDNNNFFHQFLPYDTNFLINNFFKNWRPDIVSFVDSEIWPNFILKIGKENLPFLLLNARITKKSFKRWKIVNNFASELFSKFTLCIASSKETIDYLKYFNVSNVKFFGNIKYCSLIKIGKNTKEYQFDQIINNFVWCAISTHPNEEIFLGKAHKIIQKKLKPSTLILIPRHINKIQKISSNLKKMGFDVQLKNEKDSINKNTEIALVNYYGEIAKYLKKINQIFIGKSLLGKLKNRGGQNPIDAAKLGCKVYHGPYVYNFREIYDFLGNKNLSKKIITPEELAQNIIKNSGKFGEKKHETNQELENLSKDIFNNTISEYEKLIK